MMEWEKNEMKYNITCAHSSESKKEEKKEN
jgi:hypothetical protein